MTAMRKGRVSDLDRLTVLRSQATDRVSRAKSALFAAQTALEDVEADYWPAVRAAAFSKVPSEGRAAARRVYEWWYLNGPGCEGRWPYPKEFVYPD